LALTQSRHLCGQGQQEEHDRQTEGVVPTAQVRDDGCDKKQHEADRGGYSDEWDANAGQ
jgi:hypothetical protein